MFEVKKKEVEIEEIFEGGKVVFWRCQYIVFILNLFNLYFQNKYISLTMVLILVFGMAYILKAYFKVRKIEREIRESEIREFNN